jgi:hypothetical protein
MKDKSHQAVSSEQSSQIDNPGTSDYRPKSGGCCIEKQPEQRTPDKAVDVQGESLYRYRIPVHECCYHWTDRSAVSEEKYCCKGNQRHNKQGSFMPWHARPVSERSFSETASCHKIYLP